MAEDFYDDDDGDFDETDELDDECGLGDDGQCGMAGSEHCDFVCPWRDSEYFAGSTAWRQKHSRPLTTRRERQETEMAGQMDTFFPKHRKTEDAERKITRRRICEGCGKNYADPPGALCVGCEAYKEHQQ